MVFKNVLRMRAKQKKEKESSKPLLKAKAMKYRSHISVFYTYISYFQFLHFWF